MQLFIHTRLFLLIIQRIETVFSLYISNQLLANQLLMKSLLVFKICLVSKVLQDLSRAEVSIENKATDMK